MREHQSWEQENAPYTVEGEIEGFQRFGTGVRYAGGWRRAVGLGFVFILLAPILYSLIRLVALLIL